MKITIEQTFTTAEAAAEFLARVSGTTAPAINVQPEAVDTAGKAIVGAEDLPVEKRARKPRADAGQKREPYGPRATEAAAPETGGATQREGAGGVAGAANAAPGVSAPTAGQERPTQGTVSAAAAPTPAQPPVNPPAGNKAGPKVEDFPLTLDGAKAALRRFSEAPGKGTEACIVLLRQFGVNRISDVAPDKYKEFIAFTLAQLPKAK